MNIKVAAAILASAMMPECSVAAPEGVVTSKLQIHVSVHVYTTLISY